MSRKIVWGLGAGFAFTIAACVSDDGKTPVVVIENEAGVPEGGTSTTDGSTAGSDGGMDGGTQATCLLPGGSMPQELIALDSTDGGAPKLDAERLGIIALPMTPFVTVVVVAQSQAQQWLNFRSIDTSQMTPSPRVFPPIMFPLNERIVSVFRAPGGIAVLAFGPDAANQIGFRVYKFATADLTNNSGSAIALPTPSSVAVLQDQSMTSNAGGAVLVLGADKYFFVASNTNSDKSKSIMVSSVISTGNATEAETASAPIVLRDDALAISGNTVNLYTATGAFPVLKPEVRTFDLSTAASTGSTPNPASWVLSTASYGSRTALMWVQGVDKDLSSAPFYLGTSAAPPTTVSAMLGASLGSGVSYSALGFTSGATLGFQNAPGVASPALLMTGPVDGTASLSFVWADPDTGTARAIHNATNPIKLSTPGIAIASATIPTSLGASIGVFGMAWAARNGKVDSVYYQTMQCK
jgi:hypothetical protein